MGPAHPLVVALTERLQTTTSEARIPRASHADDTNVVDSRNPSFQRPASPTGNPDMHCCGNPAVTSLLPSGHRYVTCPSHKADHECMPQSSRNHSMVGVWRPDPRRRRRRCPVGSSRFQQLPTGSSCRIRPGFEGQTRLAPARSHFDPLPRNGHGIPSRRVGSHRSGVREGEILEAGAELERRGHGLLPSDDPPHVNGGPPHDHGEV